MTELTIDQALQQGIEAHKAGELQKADRIYSAILKAQPKHPDANHNMGVLAVGVGKVQEALPFFKTALEANPATAQFWLSYIDTLIKLDKLADAKAVLDQAKSKGAKGDGFDQLEQRLIEVGQEPLEDNQIVSEPQSEQPNILDTLKLDKAIKLAKKKAKDGSYDEAKRVYQDILTKFPKNKRARDGIKALARRPVGKTSKVQDPPKEQQERLIEIYAQGQLETALKQAQFLIQKFPNSLFLNNICGVIYESLGELNASLEAYNKALVIKPDYADSHYNLGNVLKAQGKLAEAIKAYKKTLAIKPNYADAYLNMGNALKDQGKSDMAIDAFNKALAIKPDYALAHNNKGNVFNGHGKHLEAVESYNKAIAIAPDYFDAHLNMGNALRDLGKLSESIDSYKRAQAIKPDYAEAWLNMGVALKDQGQLEEAIEAFEEAIATKPDYAEAKHNLADLLKKYSSQYLQKSKIITLDTKIKKKHRENILPKIDSELANHTLQLLSELQATDKNLRTEYLQIYRANKIDLNCKRHQAVFREKKIIPNFCFGCYKVQIEVSTVLELIRLAAIFYEIEFESDLTRKCMIEVRPEIPGSYKGLIYCRGIDQARSVKKRIEAEIKATDINLIAKIKRGCSEFPLTFPRYGEIGASEGDMMQYPQEWHPLETEFDEKNLITPQTFVMPSLKEFCLSDYLIIQKWIDYSKGIGDPTSKLFYDLPVRYEEIFKIGRARVQS